MMRHDMSGQSSSQRVAVDPTAATSRKSRAALASIASNVTLIALKAIAGVLTGSVAILSDAIQSSMDLLASVITFVSVRHADAPPDAGHRYGHEKLEDLSAGMEALLLLAGALVIAAEAVHRLVSGGNVKQAGVGIAIVAIAAVTNAIVSTHLRRVGRATDSAALGADAAHLRTDALVSIGILGSLIVVKATGAQWVDPVVGVVVAAVIGLTGVRILLDSARRLVDETLPEEELAAISTVVDAFLGGHVIGYHDLRARHVGKHHQVDLHLQFTADTSLQEAHRLSHLLQDEIVADLPGTTVLIHLEPEDRVRADRFADPRPAPASHGQKPAVVDSSS
jgi:cation diffusion facilitator family transporter